MRIRIPAGDRSSRLSTAFVALFGLAFAGLGVYAGVTEWRKQPWTWAPVLGGGLFVLFGLGFASLGVFARRGVERDRAVRATRPDQPWLWNDDWASGRIASGDGAGTVGLWLLTAVVLGISSPVVFALPGQIARGEAEPLAGVAFLFPAVGLGMAGFAVRQTLRWRRFGSSELELKTFPGVVGGRLAAVLHASSALAGAEAVRFVLEAVRIDSSGDSTSERILWQGEREVPRSGFAVADRAAVPVEFAVPYECAPTSPDPSDDVRVEWRLRASAQLDGVDFGTSFDVPVFRTPESSPEVNGDAEAIPGIVVPPSGGAPLPGSRIRVKPWGAGGREFRFGMLRSPGALATCLACTAVFGGAAWLLFEQDGPWILKAGFGLTVAGLSWACVMLTVGVTRVRVEPGRIEVRGGPFGLGRARRFALHEIEAIRVDTGMQHGRKVHYRIQIHPKPPPRDGGFHVWGPVSAGTRIPDKAEARALARAMRETLGLR